jgi:hypothetical protein
MLMLPRIASAAPRLRSSSATLPCSLSGREMMRGLGEAREHREGATDWSERRMRIESDPMI